MSLEGGGKGGVGAGQLLQVLSFAFLSSYLTVEYIWPFIKRHWWSQSSLQKRLQVRRTETSSHASTNLHVPPAVSSIPPSDYN